MAEPEFPSNSTNPLSPKQPSKPPVEEKQIEKVVTGRVIQKPLSIGKRLKKIFTGADAKGTLHYIVSDVLGPALKNMFVDTVSRGAERFVYRGEPTRRYQSSGPRVSYNSPVQRPYSRTMLPDQPPRPDPRQRQSSLRDTILHSKEEAELVLERLQDIIDTYEVASVADLNELLGLQSPHIDHKWGWHIISFANVQQVREGWLLNLPEPEPINN